MRPRADDVPVRRSANTALRKHHAAVYPPVALAHVARQIDALYRASLPPSTTTNTNPLAPSTAVPSSTADLRAAATIAALPAQWPEPGRNDPPARPSSLEAFDRGARYGKLRARAAALAEKKEAARGAAARARALAGLAAGLRAPGERVQGSLVTRDGALRRELERLVVLCARLRGRVEAEGAEAGGGGAGEGEERVTDEEMGMGVGRGMGRKRART